MATVESGPIALTGDGATSAAERERAHARAAGDAPRTSAPPAIRADAETRTRWTIVARSMSAGVRYGACAAVGTWIADVVSIAGVWSTTSASQWWTAVGASLVVTLSSALAVGAIVGAIFGRAIERTADAVVAFAMRLRRGDDDARRAVAAYAIAAAVVVAVGAWGAYHVALAALFDLARSDSIAGALAVSHLVFAGIVALAWPAALRGARAAVDAAARTRALRWLATRSWIVPGVLTAGAALATRAILGTHNVDVRVLPWREWISLVGAVAGVAVAAVYPRARFRFERAARWTAAFATALVAIATIGGIYAAARLRPESSVARKLAFERALGGRAGHAVWTALLDVDRDGQLSLLGGGDCAPLDARRHLGAVEIPGNGVDEDCDGVDLPAYPIRARGRLFVGQNALPMRPSFVLVTVDALAAPRLVALGASTPLMPNVEELAGSGALFTHFFAQGPSTRLSFPSMFTSRWDSELVHQFAPRHPYPLAPTERQIQDILDDAGYETIAVVANDYFEKHNWATITRGFQHVDTTAVAFGKHNAAHVTDAAIRALDAPHDRPIFLWVHYYDAHGPYLPLPGVSYTKDDDEERYDVELSSIDGELKRLFDRVAARPDPTYTLFTSDHATVFHPDPATRHGHYGYDLYTATLHVPFILRGPGIHPMRVDGVASTMDILPTVLDLAHLVDRPGTEGNSLLPEILAGRSEPDRTLFHEFYLAERDFRGDDPLQLVSARDRRWNLILDRVHGTYELYDWTADYYERRDVYEDHARSPEIGRLRSLLGAFVGQFHRRAPAAATSAATSATSAASASRHGDDD